MKIAAIVLSILLLLVGVFGVVKRITPDREEELVNEENQYKETVFTFEQNFENLKDDLGEQTGAAGKEFFELLDWKVYEFDNFSSASIVKEGDTGNSYLKIKNAADGKMRFTVADDGRLRNGFIMEFDYYLAYGSQDAGPVNVLGSDWRAGTWNVSLRSLGQVLNSCKSESDSWLYSQGIYNATVNAPVDGNIDCWKTIRIEGSYDSGVIVSIKDRGARNWEITNRYTENLLKYAQKSSNFMDGVITFFISQKCEVYLDNLSVSSLNGSWSFLERLEYGDVVFSEETIARMEQGGRFKIVAFSESSVEQKLSLSALATLTVEGGTSYEVTLFQLESDQVGVPTECIFEINPAEGHTYSDIHLSGNIFDTADVYVYVYEEVS